MMVSDKPLMLKDYLELDSNLDSYPIHGFQRYTNSMRNLLEFELRCGSDSGRKLIRTRSKNALLKLSSLIKLDFLLFSCSPSSNNKRSRSRNFLKKNIVPVSTGGFWKKRGSEEEEKRNKKGDSVRVKDIVRLRSFNLPAPASSSSSSSSPASLSSSSRSSSWSESDFNGSDFLPSSNGSSEFIPDITDNKCSPLRTEASHGGSENKVVTSESTGCNSEEEEKDQLSPVSIMDFRYNEGEEGAEEEEEESISDSSFHANLAVIERAKEALLQKLRRFESLAELVPVDLNNQFSDVDAESSRNLASDDDDVDDEEVTIEMEAWKLLDHIKSRSSISIGGRIEKLLVEFLVEGLKCNPENNSFASIKLVNAATKWIESESDCWEQRNNRVEMEVDQMDWNGQCRCFDEEKQEFAVCLANGVMGSMIDEVVRELILC